MINPTDAVMNTTKEEMLSPLNISKAKKPNTVMKKNKSNFGMQTNYMMSMSKGQVVDLIEQY